MSLLEKLNEKLLYVLGVLLVLWGLIFVIAGVLNMLNPERQYSMATYPLAMTLLGVVPGVGGVVLCRQMRQRGRRRQD